MDDNGDETFKALAEQAEEVKKGLDRLETRFRVPPKTKGYVYDDDKVVNRIGMAQNYVGSTWDAPTDTAEVYVEQARAALDDALEALNQFMAGEVTAFAKAADQAGISLFSPVTPLQAGTQQTGT